MRHFPTLDAVLEAATSLRTRVTAKARVGVCSQSRGFNKMPISLPAAADDKTMYVPVAIDCCKAATFRSECHHCPIGPAPPQPRSCSTSPRRPELLCLKRSESKRPAYRSFSPLLIALDDAGASAPKRFAVDFQFHSYRSPLNPRSSASSSAMLAETLVLQTSLFVGNCFLLQLSKRRRRTLRVHGPVLAN